jgi:hypothetical protein
MKNSTKDERFAEFLRRLEAAPRVSTRNEAIELLRGILNGVEDEMTDIPDMPKNARTDGRMYPPQGDSARNVSGRSDLVRYRSRGHNTYVRQNGAMEIRDLTATVIISKAGADGVGVELED